MSPVSGSPHSAANGPISAMSTSLHNDVVWNTAWEWVVREHEQPLDAAARQQLTAWLDADPAHRTAYEKASHRWLLAGLIPPP